MRSNYRRHDLTAIDIDWDDAWAELQYALAAAGHDPHAATDPPDDAYLAAIPVAAARFADLDHRVTDIDRAFQFCAQLNHAVRRAADDTFDTPLVRSTWSLDDHARAVVRCCIEQAVTDLLTDECFPNR